MLTRPSSAFPATDGAAYEVWLGRWARRLAEPFLDFAAFPATGDLLDVGCGTGALTFAMAARWPDRGIVGADLAAPFIDYACARRGGNRPTFEVADVFALPYEDHRFAGASAHLLFLFLPRPEAALRELARVTRRGGTVAAVVWDSRGGLVYQRMMWDTAVAIDPGARSVRDALFANPMAVPGGLEGAFRDAGLNDVAVRSITVRMDYASFDDYWLPFFGGQGPVGAYFASLAPDLTARLREAVCDAYCSGAPDGPRSMTATAWAVRGQVL